MGVQYNLVCITEQHNVSKSRDIALMSLCEVSLRLGHRTDEVHLVVVNRERVV